MFCKNCGKEIDDKAYVCLNCGAKTAGDDQIIEDKPNYWAGLATCCMPVGLVLYFQWKDEKPETAKLICYWMLGGTCWIIGMYLALFILGLMVPR